MLKQIRYMILAAAAVVSSCGAGRSPSASAEERPRDTDSALLISYDFILPGADTVYDPRGILRPFFAKLHRLDSLRRGTLRPEEGVSAPFQVNILHFGDSHIQAGFLTSTLMHHLHHRFGNAGRGMIVPHKLSGSNEPQDYAIRVVPSSGGSWSSSRVVQPRPTLPIGISGLAIRSSSSTNRLLLCAFSTDSTLDYRFNRVRVFHDRYAPIIEAPKSLSTDGDVGDLIYDFHTDLDLIRLVDSLEIETHPDGQFSGGPLYGFSLENGQHGILYHALGINSSCYLHWGRQSAVVRQSVALSPDLILLSLGSNEASGSQFNESVFYREVDRFVGPLREANPGAAIVLTSPAQAFKRGAPNRNFSSVARTLKRYAQEKGVAFIDLYGMSGGEGSALHWSDHHLMARDKIHYTEEGYHLQGILLYNALYNGYTGHGRTAAH